jgi:pyridoxal phosphate enzyme (YggS family)
MTINNIASNFNRISEIIFETAIKTNRDPNQIKLVVVTKSQPIEKIKTVIRAGAKFLGENYPEETLQKFENELNILNTVELHMIGHLQSRKSKMVVEHFNCLHSLDSLKLANRLNQQLEQRNKFLDVLLQFNVAGEISKFGWNASEKNDWNLLVDEVIKIKNNCKNLNIIGLMTMPPLATVEREARKNFEKLVDLGNYFQEKIPGLKLSDYSMGTTHDFQFAISEGATMVRIGTAIMGPRENLEV